MTMATIKQGQHSSVQGELIKLLKDGKAAVRVGEKIVIGELVDV